MTRVRPTNTAILLSPSERRKFADPSGPRFRKLRLHFLLQACADARPVIAHNGVNYRIANAATAHHHVAAQDSFLPGPDADNGRPRFAVEHIGEQFDAVALQVFKCVFQHQVFRFRINVGSLPRPSEKRKANFEPLVNMVDVSETGASCNVIALLVDYCEGKFRVRVKCGFGVSQESIQVLRMGYQRDVDCPELTVCNRCGQTRLVLRGEGFESESWP